MPLSMAFYGRTEAAYYKMRTRLREKKNKNGKVIRVGFAIGFTLDQFREWTMGCLGGDPNGCGKCFYCHVPIDAMNFSPDHMTPLALGGSPGLENLAFCCANCNLVKGKMLAEEFLSFREWCIEHLSMVSWVDVMKRLKMGAAGARMRFFPRDKAKPKAAVPPQENSRLPLEDEF